MTAKEVYVKYFKNASVLNKLIIINAAVFLIFPILGTLSFLFQYDLGSTIKDWLAFPKSIYEFLYKPWTIVTYAFLHGDIFHVLFNMLWLYFFGQLFLNIHTGRRFLNLYFLGAIFGALAYMVTYNLFPAFLTVGKSNLRGASAAVSAIMVAATMQSPNMPLRFMFIPISFKLWWITVGLLVWDFIQIPSGNAGGHISHLGGALIGYLYMKQLQKGNDIGAFVGQFMDWFLSLLKPSQKTKLKTVHKKTKANKVVNTKVTRAHPNQQQIDAILDKISKSGYDSLSKKEKEVLFNAGK